MKPDPVNPTPNESSEPTIKPKVPLAIEDALTAAVMGALALITFINVLVRYFTDQSFAWTEEISVFLMIVLALVGGSIAFARNHHIRIEFFVNKCNPQQQRWLGEFAAWLGALMFFALAILSARLVWDQYEYEEISPAIGVPQWWYSIWLPLLSLVIGLRLIGLWMRTRKSS
ncbi:TRAP transporter small permease [Orrella daihaiensis]|uniref:TRAP transporter small permease protein n=1 Tax=Orrella daihaiensis TaxID=2782176 RepID=A0ABY4AGB6_9BURK|nr:TRAP transporter small permease [Orrella daihaiensis]UOD49224.1 TRAP transporter small permease [Orrella daihaiensis]